MKEFNLELAKAGHPVQTRNGKEENDGVGIEMPWDYGKHFE